MPTYKYATPKGEVHTNSRGIKNGDIFEITHFNGESFDTKINGNSAFCLVHGCAFLRGGDWLLLESLTDENGEEYEDE